MVFGNIQVDHHVNLVSVNPSGCLEKYIKIITLNSFKYNTLSVKESVYNIAHWQKYLTSQSI